MKTPKCLLLTALAFVLACSNGSRAQENPAPTAREAPMVLTLEKAIVLALEQNRDVLIADQDRYKADAQVSEARSGAFPQIGISGQYTRNVQKPVLFIPPNNPFNPTSSTMVFELGSDNGYSLGAQFAQVLFNRKVGVALDIAGTFEEYSEKAYSATTQDVTFSVKKAFYGILLAQKLVEANRQGLDVVRANLENVQALYRHGNAAEFDLLRAEVQLANTEPLATSAENALLLATNAMKNLLAIPMEREIQVQGEFVFEEIPAAARAQAESEAVTRNPSMVGLALQESILEKNISIEQSNYFPTLTLVGSYQWQSQDNTFQFSNYLWAKTFFLGLQISYPLFDGFRTGSRVEQASVDRMRVHYLRLKAEEGLRIAVQSAELKMEEAQKRITGQEKSIDQARKAVRIAQTRFKSGVGTQLELLDTQVAMTRAETNYAQAMYDYLLAKAEWERAVGISQ